MASIATVSRFRSKGARQTGSRSAASFSVTPTCRNDFALAFPEPGRPFYLFTEGGRRGTPTIRPSSRSRDEVFEALRGAEASMMMACDIKTHTQ